MSKLPSERIGEIISEKYNPDFATERDRINAIIAYLDETAKEKECEHKDTNWNSTFQILRCKDCGKAL